MIVKRVYQLHCELCGFIKCYEHGKDVPEKCPACQDIGSHAWTKTEKAYKDMPNPFPDPEEFE